LKNLDLIVSKLCIVVPPYAVLLILRLPSTTLINGVGTVAGSFTVPFTGSTDTVKQHPRGTSTVARDVTFPYSSTATGVMMALLPLRSSPDTTIAVAIGVTAPPVGMEMLPVNATSYRAKHAVGLLTAPRRTKIPVPD
jgi:hypothetical protein